MSTRDDIRAAFKRHGPLSLSELAQHCPSCENDRQIVASAIAVLRAEGKVKGFGYDAGNKPVYSIDAWPENETAAERSPDRAPTPVTTPSPARPAVSPEEPMKEKKPLRERVVAALREHGNMTLEQLAKRADTTVGSLYQLMGTLKKLHGVAKISQVGKGPAIFGLAGKGAPPQKPDALERGGELGRRAKAARKPAKKRKPNGAHRAPKPAHPRPNVPTNGNGAAFAINEYGELGVHRGKEVMKLDAAEFTRLREFIERTEPVWQGGK